MKYGVFSRAGEPRRVGGLVGDQVLDLAALAADTGRPEAGALAMPVLNAWLALGRGAWVEVHGWAADAVETGAAAPYLLPAGDVTAHLPIGVGDYVDFYSSRHHAENVGRIFRPQAPALPDAWSHLPIGYHGRAGTVVVSGSDVVRPTGQRRGPDGPVFGPSTRLDIEAEVGFVVGFPSRLGEPVPVEAFADHVFGVVLLNDWSARDLQAWEYVPLGPFLGKSFATSVAAWVTPLADLSSARVSPPPLDPPPLPYLTEADPWGLDLRLEVALNGTVVSRPPFATMSWTAAQQLAHLTSNGASVRTGDLYGSGTVSGPRADERGSLLELTWNGTEPLSLGDGSTREFLEDGDEVVVRGTFTSADGTAGALAPVAGRILPAR